jgi:hypothetical protein
MCVLRPMDTRYLIVIVKSVGGRSQYDIQRVVSRFALQVDACTSADKDSMETRGIRVVDRLSLLVRTGSAPPAGIVGLVLFDSVDVGW